MSSLHLHPVEAAAPQPAPGVDTVFFVIQRDNGHWSPAAKIIGVFDDEQKAEAMAFQRKQLNPHQHFGVAKLRSEARTVANPIEIVRARNDLPPFDGNQVAT